MQGTKCKIVLPCSGMKNYTNGKVNGVDWNAKKEMLVNRKGK